MAVGDLLRAAREQRGLTLQQVSADTKIPLDRLAAFEEDRLPPNPGFYEKAQARAFAQAVHLDYRLVLDAMNPPPPPEPAVAVPDEPAPSPRRVHISHGTMTIAGAILAIVSGAVIMSTQSRPATIAEAAPAPVKSIEPRVSATGGILDAQAAPTPTPVEPAAVAAPTPAPVESAAVTAPRADSVLPPLTAPPVVAQLVITSKPEGARVTVDGIGWGVTPLTIRHLNSGPKRIRVTSDGYAAAERVVEVGSGGAANVVIQLRALAPSIEPES